ncbi:hypothetical protein, partial [Escherichia coli]|uniref:hypothetical protein n=1 Tax=Escherichia coli TaxID=562 RepID=UPI001BCECB43
IGFVNPTTTKPNPTQKSNPHRLIINLFRYSWSFSNAPKGSLTSRAITGAHDLTFASNFVTYGP